MAYKGRSGLTMARNPDFRSIFSSSTELVVGSVAEILEGLRRRADYDITLRLHFEHREPALHEPARGKAEQPVNPGEPARVEDRLLREGLCIRAARQHPGECRGIIAKRCQTRRIAAVDGAEVLREDPPRLGRSRSEPAADERRLVADIGHVPKPAAEQLHWLCVALCLLDLARHLFERIAPLRQQQRV